MSTDLMSSRGTSPFDAIRLTDEAGLGYWSARDLMPLLDYDRWERFEDAVARAEAAINNSDEAARDHIRGAAKMVTLGSGARRNIIDYHLTRYGAYMVAMNSDPRKSAVAAAQSYFAIKTREAETRPALPDLSTAEGVLVMAEQFAATARELVAERARVAELTPRAEVADRLLDADGDLSVADAAKALTRAGIDTGATRMFKTLAGLRWIYRGQADGRWHVYQSAIETGWMSALPQSHFHPKTGELVMDAPQPRVTPKGLQRLMRELTPAVELQPA